MGPSSLLQGFKLQPVCGRFRVTIRLLAFCSPFKKPATHTHSSLHLAPTTMQEYLGSKGIPRDTIDSLFHNGCVSLDDLSRWFLHHHHRRLRRV